MKAERKTVIINNLDIIVIIPIHDIVYFQADGSYCKVITKDGKTHLWCKRIGEVFNELDDPLFIKISRSILINTIYLRYIHKRSKEVELVFSMKKFLPYTMQLKSMLGFAPGNK